MPNSSILTVIGIGIGVVALIITIISIWFKFHQTLVERIDTIPERIEVKLRLLLDTKPTSVQPKKSKNDLRADLIAIFEKAHKDAEQALAGNKSVILHDFRAGWDALFLEFFRKDTQPARIFRDFTLSRYSESSFGAYNFETYPVFVRTYMQQRDDSDRRWQYRILIACDSSTSSDSCNKSAQRYLERVLELKFIESGLSFVDRFRKWKETWGDNSSVQIRLVGEKIVSLKKLELAESPFNVYGEKAVSRSILMIKGGWAPNPHLEINLRKDVIDSHKKAFDELWKAAQDFQTKVFSTTNDQELEGNADTGALFRRWCSLDK